MSLDEFSIIERFFASIAKPGPNVITGPGDDCAIVTVPDGHELCVSTDTLISGVHFPDDAAATVVASRTLAANLSDLAAMGALPHSFLLALTLPDVDESWLEEFSAALAQGAEHYGLSLVGGNLARGPLSLTMTVLGITPTGAAVTRHGAAIPDDIYVSGFVGDAGIGLCGMQSDRDVDDYLVSRYTNPTPRLELGIRLRNIATAMIDVSDGLLADLNHLLLASGVGGDIELDKIPLSVPLVAALGIEEASMSALVSGDDYELCFTAGIDKRELLRLLEQELDVKLTRIGHITSNPGARVLSDGTPVELKVTGYQHFK